MEQKYCQYFRTGDCGHFPFLESPEEWAAALDDYKGLCNRKINRNS